MGTDWNQPRDTGPQASDWVETPGVGPAQPKKRSKKPYGIEYRMNPEALSRMPSWLDWGTWRTSRWYETAKQRDEALGKLNKNRNHGGKFSPAFEYRACERD